MKIDWKRKLTSRKFWAAIIGCAGTLLIAFGVETVTAEQVTACISACAVAVAYIIGEGLVDAAHTGGAEEKDDRDQ